jgi:hypothetical protein
MEGRLEFKISMCEDATQTAENRDKSEIHVERCNCEQLRFETWEKKGPS